jgi:hypothetical protein
MVLLNQESKVVESEAMFLFNDAFKFSRMAMYVSKVENDTSVFTWYVPK